MFPALRTLYHECTQHHPARDPTNLQLQNTLIRIFEQLCASAKITPVHGSRKSDGRISAVAAGETFLIIDALDKIPINRRDGYLTFIKDIVRRKFMHLHILVTSQDQGSIRAALTKCGEWTMIPLDRETMEAAMRMYVTNAIQADSQLEDLSLEMKEVIVSRLIDERRGR